MDGERGRSVVFVVAVSLFHVIVLSSPPLLPSLCVPSLRQRAEECGLLAPASSLSSSDPGRVGRVRGGVETRAEIHCVALLKNVHNSSASLPPSAASRSASWPAQGAFFAPLERARASAHGGKWVLSN